MTESVHTDPAVWLDEHGDYLYRYAYSRLGSKHTAEDVIQETFLAAIKGLQRYDGRAPVRYWLLGILKHKVVDYIRKASRETPVEDLGTKEITDSFQFKWMGIPNEKTQPWRISPRKVFEQKEFWEVFSLCVSELKDSMRVAFTLKELEGASTEEVCKSLDITPNNLWVILHRARGQLKTCLETKWISKHSD